MSLADFVFDLAERGVRIFVVEGKLKTVARQDCLTETDAAFIRQHKAALIDYLAQKKQVELSAVPLFSQPQITEGPLSFAQRRLWYFYQRNPADCAYNICHAVRCRVDVSLTLLTAVLQQLIDRHPILRSVFYLQNDEPRQRILADFQLDIPVLELTDAQLDALIAKEWQTPFLLERQPPFRVKALTGPTGLILLYSFHHIAIDGYSADIFLRDFSRLYQQLSTGNNVLSADSRVNYLDYVLWEQELVQRGVYDFQLDYWHKQLQGLPQQPASFSQHRLQNAVDVAHGGEWRTQLPDNLVAALKTTAAQRGMTPFMLALAALYQLLARYSGQNDLVIGTPHANRPHDDLQQVLGFFVNMLPLRVDLNTTNSPEQLLQLVKRTVLQAFEHHMAPFEQVVKQLGGQRQTNTQPLFNVCLAYQNANDRDYQTAEQEFTLLPTLSSQVRFPIQFSLYPQGDQLTLVIEYSYVWFNEDFVRQLATGFTQTLLLLCQPQNLPLSFHEVECTNPTVHFPVRQSHLASSITARVDRTVQQYPERTALVDGDRRFNYRQLEDRVNQLAALLQAQHISSGQRVAICMNRSAEVVIAILACLKLGCAYVPVDPKVPASRRHYILQDAAPAVLLVDQAGDFPSNLLQIHVTDWPQVGGEWQLSLPVVDPTTVAYIIYTSGSTGQPKGVCVTHDNVSRLFDACDRHYDFGCTDVWSLYHSYGFDFSVWEMFGALFYGGCIEVVPAEVSENTEAFIQFLRHTGVTVLNQTPSAFRQLVNTLTASDLNSVAVRHVIFGGEKLELACLQTWYALDPATDVQFHNMYGITETTVHVTYQRLSKSMLDYQVSLVGEPLDDLELLLLDRQGRPALPFAVGEAYVGGRGVSLGYLNQTAQTASRFVTPPAGFNCQSAVLYRTGDLMSFIPGLGLVYCQRNDQQVQLRGFRVELDDIGNVLRQCPVVKDVEIRLWQRDDDQAIVAYVIAKQTGSVAPEFTQLMTEVFEETYQQAAVDEFSGWTSSVTNQLIDVTQMQLWASHTVQRIRSLAPRRLLELGCGSGILATRLAPDLSCYVGLDISTRALACTRQRLANYPALSLALYQHDITDFTAVVDQQFDCIVINSVVQYLPDQACVRRLVTNAVKRLSPDGYIFIGDVLNLALQQEYLQWLADKRTELGMPTQLEMQKELQFSAAYFTALAAELDLPYCLVLPKAESTDNEMTHFRFDVVLGLQPPSMTELLTMQFNSEPVMAQVAQWINILTERQVDALCITQMPNPALANICQQATNLPWQAVNQLLLQAGFVVEPYFTLDTHPHQIGLCISQHGYSLGNLPVQTLRDSQQLAPTHNVVATTLQQLQQQVRHYAQTELPAYMVPQYIEILPRWPVTANGKLDEQALPAPTVITQSTEATEQVALSATEALLSEIWCRLLHLPAVGCLQNFFEVGGHSLLAARMSAEIERTFQLKVGIHQIFKLGTIRGLAKEIDGQQFSTVVRIEAAPAAADYPLSYAQRRLWIMDQHLQAEQACAYNMPTAFAVPEAIDLSLLRQALQLLVNKHDILRTYFVLTADGPRQCIASGLMVDFEHLPAETTKTVPIAIAAVIARPFDLTKLPLFRVSCIAVPGKCTAVVLNMHHVITDGWSMQLMQQQWLALYQQLAAGKTPILADNALTYRDYAVWQQMMGQDYWQASLHKMLDRLQNAPHVHGIPLDQSRQSQANYQGSVWLSPLPAELAAEVGRLCRQLGVNPMQLFCGLFAAIMRAADQNDALIVGVPVTERDCAGLEQTLGYFVNSMPVLFDLSLDVPIQQWFSQGKQNILQGLAARHLPFDVLVDALKVPRQLNHQPLFQLLFSYQHADTSDDLAAAAGITALGIPWQYAKYDLNLEIVELPVNGFMLKWEYASSLFKAQSIERWHQQLIALLTELCRVDLTQTRLLKLLPARVQLAKSLIQRDQWQANESLFQRFTKMVLLYSQSPAVWHAGQYLSYAELNDDVASIACYLSSQGLQAGDTLLFNTDCRYQSLCLMLAALRQGVIFAPFDNHWPQARYTQVSEVLKPALEVGPNTLQQQGRWSVERARPLAVASELWPLPYAGVPEIAACMFTSGTTGKPKGVLVPQQGILRLVVANDYVPLGPQTVMLQFASIAFDAATFEIFGALLNGGTLVLAPQAPDVFTALGALINQCQINTAWLTAGFFEHWVPLVNAELPLRYLIVGGDVVSPLAVAQLYRLNPELQLINGYGPTENTTFSATYPIPRHHDPQKAIPVGYCLAGSNCVVLDEQQRPVAYGIEGELHVGGAGLAIGYLADPELTTRKFVHLNGLSGRYYATGDRVTMDSDGCLHFRGRQDDLVKLNGFRLELGEIEQQLLQIAGITAAVVLAEGQHSGDKVIKAAIECDSDVNISDEQICTMLGLVLPFYMIPVSFRRYRHLPLNSNGKFDRNLLRLELAQQLAVPQQFSTDNDMLDLLQRCLRALNIGPLDPLLNFFSSGGNSLLAIRLINMVNEELSVSYPVTVLYQYPTLSALALFLKTERQQRQRHGGQKQDIVEVIL